MPGIGVCSPSSPGVGIGVGGSLSGAAPASPNPNLLLWSEALDNAVWAKSGAVVTANAALDPDGQMTAESVAFAANGSLTQVTPVAGAVVTGGGTRNPSATLGRVNLSITVDGVGYILSAYLANGTGSDLILSAFSSGGFVAVRFRDGGDGATFTISWVKLETPSLSAYVKREGT